MKYPINIQTIIALLILGVTAPIYAQSCSNVSLGNNANLNGFVPFPASNAWNTNIANASVDVNSAAITSAAGFAGLNLHPDFGTDSEYGIPYMVVDSSATPSVSIDVVDYADESDVVVAPYPATAPIEGNQADCTGGPGAYIDDAHVLVLDRAKCWLYETYNTTRCNGLWKASSETIWDMNHYESRPWGWTSADAAGLPIFPGLVRYDEVASGAIHHALRFTMEHTDNNANDGYFVLPASHAAGTEWGVSNVMGMRIRLKASFDISGFSTTNQVILTAMKQYGMILADNGGSFFFQGAPDSRWNDDDLNNLKNISSSNFEVVQMTPDFPGMDSVSAYTDYPGVPPTINSFTPSATTVGSGSAVTFTYSASGDSYDFIDKIGPVTAGSGSVTIYPTATQTYTLNSTNASGRVTSTAITVTVSGSVAASPVFSPVAGTYSSAQTVSISDATSGATIYYTTDGVTTPTTSSTAYTGPITVSSTETVKAIAVASGYTNSAVASATYTISLTTQSFSVAISPTSLTVQAGKSGTATVTVTPQGGFASAVTFSCSGLPSGASCSFAPTSVTPSGAAASTTLTVTTTTASAALHRDGQPLLPLTALGAVLCCLGWKKRRCLPVLLLAVSLIGMGLLNGCGGNFSASGLTSPSSTSTVTVLATSGSQQSSTTFSLTVN